MADDQVNSVAISVDIVEETAAVASSRITIWIYCILRQVLFWIPGPPNPMTSRMIKDQELGKFVLNIGVSITTTVLFSSSISGKVLTVYVSFMLNGVTVGCAAIWNGILMRESFPRTSIVCEQVGIIMVFVSFSGLVASAFPMEFAWTQIICACSFLVPFVLAVLAPDHHRQIAPSEGA